MKARVISTRRVVDVVKTTRTKIIHDYFGGQNNIEIVEYYDGKNRYTEKELEFDVNYDPDYWTRLEHQYAGMAMQGIVSSYEAMREISKERDIPQYVANMAFGLAHALMEKMKEEKK